VSYGWKHGGRCANIGRGAGVPPKRAEEEGRFTMTAEDDVRTMTMLAEGVGWGGDGCRNHRGGEF